MIDPEHTLDEGDLITSSDGMGGDLIVIHNTGETVFLASIDKTPDDMKVMGGLPVEFVMEMFTLLPEEFKDKYKAE